jgi:hypothetical protein
LLLYTLDVFVVEIGKRNHGADKQEQEGQFDIHDRNLLAFHVVVGAYAAVQKAGQDREHARRTK